MKDLFAMETDDFELVSSVFMIRSEDLCECDINLSLECFERYAYQWKDSYDTFTSEVELLFEEMERKCDFVLQRIRESLHRGVCSSCDLQDEINSLAKRIRRSIERMLQDRQNMERDTITGWSSYMRTKLEERLDDYYSKLGDVYFLDAIWGNGGQCKTCGDVSENISALFNTVISHKTFLKKLNFERFGSKPYERRKFLIRHPELLLNSGADRLLIKLLQILPYDHLHALLTRTSDKNGRTPLFYFDNDVLSDFLIELYRGHDQELHKLLSIKDNFGCDMFSGPFPISSRLSNNRPKLPKKLPGFPIPTKDKQNETAIGLAGGSNNSSIGGAGRAARPALELIEYDSISSVAVGDECSVYDLTPQPAYSKPEHTETEAWSFLCHTKDVTKTRPSLLTGERPKSTDDFNRLLQLTTSTEDLNQSSTINPPPPFATDDGAALIESSVALLITAVSSLQQLIVVADFITHYHSTLLSFIALMIGQRSDSTIASLKESSEVDNYHVAEDSNIGEQPLPPQEDEYPELIWDDEYPEIIRPPDGLIELAGESSEMQQQPPIHLECYSIYLSSYYEEDFILPPHYYEYRRTTPIEPITCYITPKFPEHINSSLPPATLARIEKMTADRFLHHILEEMTLDEREVLMCDEAHRRRTFESKWPHQLPATMPLQPDRLAANGFYHLGEADKVQCAFCRIILKSWDPHDDVGTEHKRHMPLCKLVLKKDCGNIPYIGFKEKLTTDDLQRFNVKRYDVDGPRAVPIAPEEYGINLAKPFRPEYAPIQTRKESFRIVKSDRLKFDIQRAIDSGFYYTGFEDYVRCFHCNGGLRNWSEGDDPHIEHARWFPICSYLIALKGREWVDNTFDATPTGRRNDKYAEVVKIDQKVEERRRDTREVMEDCIINMGFDKKIMKRAWRKDGPFLTMKEYLKSIYAIEDHGRRYEPLNARSVQVKPLHPKRVELSDSGAEASPVSDYTDSGSEGSLDLMAKDTSRVEEDEEMDNSKPLELTATNNKAEDIPDELKCRVPRCRSGFRSQATYLALPCGHITFCQNCVDYMDKKNKPLLETCVRSGCRTPVRAHMRFFTA